MRALLSGVLATVLCLISLGGAQAEKRVALLIGNSGYSHSTPLSNPKNDASALADRFRQLGFDKVTLKLDVDANGLRRALGQFSRDAAGAGTAVIYFAGHGIEVDGTNYVIPTDARLSHVDDVDFEAVELDKLVRSLNRAKRLKLVILDACRDNPFKNAMSGAGGSRSVGRGLARVNPSGGNTLVAYAAREGTVAADGKGKHSPYANALLKHLATPGLDVRLLFGKVRDDVLAATGRKQEPFTYGSLGGEAISLAPAAGAPGVVDANTVEQLKSRLKALEARLNETPQVAPSQHPSTSALAPRQKQFEKVYGGAKEELAWSINTHPAGGYIVAGNTESKVAGKAIGWILRLDKEGKILWQKTTDSFGASDVHTVRPLAGGGLIAVGTFRRNGKNERRGFAAKLDENGDTVWNTILEVTDTYSYTVVTELGDGSIVVGSEINRDKKENFWLIRLSASGEPIWQKTFGGGAGEFVSDVNATSNGILVLASNKSKNGKHYQGWLFELDLSGNLIWEQLYDTGVRSELVAMTRLKSGDYILAGTAGEGGDKGLDYWALRVKPDGTKVWERRLDRALADQLWVAEVTEGGYIILGGDSAANSDGSDPGGWIVALDQDGNRLADRVIKRKTQSSISFGTPRPGGGVTFLGHLMVKGANDFWVFTIPEPVTKTAGGQ